MAGIGYYHINIAVWPHSTGIGAEKDQEACGPRRQGYNVHAIDFDDAYKQAKLLAQGMRTNPRVWETPIESIAFVSEVRPI